MNLPRSVLVCAATALVLGACSTAPAPEAAPRSASATIRPSTGPGRTIDSLMAVYDREGSPGAAILVFRGDDQLFAKGFGRANLEYDAPITPRTVFHVASVSKQFTAFAIASLAAQGRLSLDDDVRKHLPEVPDFGRRITLRHLLHHTSGLRDQWSLWQLSGGRMDDVIRQEDLMRLVTRQRELNFDPGAESAYSNTGYMLLAQVVRRVTGEEFGPWMKANVFVPLGMNDTQVYDDHERIVPGRAYSYRPAEGGFEKAVLSYANSGATSLFTTAEDLARWLRNFGHARVGGPDVARLMRTRGVLNRGDTVPYALGVVLGRNRGLEFIRHNGADAGFRSSVIYYPALDAGVVVLGNVTSLDADAIALKATEAFFAAEMEPGTAPAAPPPAADEPTVAVDTAVLIRYTGQWEIPGGPTVRLEREGDRLVLVQGRRGVMRAASDSTFLLSDPAIRLTFHREPNGEVNRATLVQGGQTALLRRVVPFTPSAAELGAYAGRYYSPELETVYTVVLEDGRLVARHRRHGDVPLAARQANVFDGGTGWLGRVEFERGADGAVTAMRISNPGGRLRRVRFEKLD